MMSWAKAALSRSSTMALPPYLMTMSAPRNRSSHGRASTRVCALAAAAAKRFWPPGVRTLSLAVLTSKSIDMIPRSLGSLLRCDPHSRPSCRIRRVLVDVVVGQVIGPDGRRLLPCVQVHHDVHLPSQHVDQRSVLADPSRSAHLYSVDGHVQGRRLKRGPSRPDRREDTAPVRVAAEDRTLEQVVAGDRTTDLEGVGNSCRRTDLDRDVMFCALSIGDELPCEICTD